MDISKHFSLFLQTVSIFIMLLTFVGIKSESVPTIFQPLFIIPWYGYGLIFVILIIIIITGKEKIRQIRSAPPPPPALQRVDAIVYQGVTWDILAPVQHPLEKQVDYARRLPTIGGAKIPPRCPKCGVELEEKEGLIYGHIWRCVACGFKKRNKDSFSTEAGRAEKIWRAKAEADAEAAVIAAAATTATAAPAPAATVPKE